MARHSKAASILVIVAVATAAAVVATIWVLPGASKARFPATRAASAPTQPVALLTTAPSRPPAYIDVIRAENSAVATTQLLAMPLDLSDAAHLVLHDPLLLDQAGMLWITRAGAAPTSSALAQAQDPSEHVIPDRAAYIHWWLDDQGLWQAAVVARRADGGFVLISAKNRMALPTTRRFHWAAAFSWQNRIVVPSEQGVSVFDVLPALVEHYHAIPGASAAGNSPVALLDARGVLAWAPWEHGRSGSHGASRFVDGNWVDLNADLWAGKPIQLIPLLDGSVLQIAMADASANAMPAGAPPTVAAQADSVSLVIAPLDSASIDVQHINDLLTELDDPDDQKRQAAFAELSRYGPGLAPILEKVSQDQPPETRLRLRQLLRAKVTPALDGLEIIDNRLSVARRQDDGTVLFFASAGVRVPRAQQEEPATVSPAWICMRPGGRVDPPLPATLVRDQLPDACTLMAVRDDWLVCDDTGVRRFFGNALVPLTGPSEQRFHHMLGQDRRGRWLIGGDGDDTLIIDPTIADPSPRLPGWAMTIDKGQVGWNRFDWPVIQRGGAWALTADTWVPLKSNDPIHTVAPPPPPYTAQPLHTGPATTQAALVGPPLLRTRDGTCYFDGKTMLTAIDAQGKRIDWPLPPTAVGSIAPLLVRTADGSLYLYNQPGRMLCLKPLGASEPFQLAATFTRGIPNTDHPTRIWVDPAGRIDFEYDGDQLVVLFPTGFIPPEIQKMMPE